MTTPMEYDIAPDAIDPNESTRPIRALLRGLQALQSLNEHNGATVTEVAKITRLPRTTAYRVLETLRVGGYADRDPNDDRYRPTIKVRMLAEGYEQEAWIRDIARPRIEDLSREIVWPVSLSTLSGSTMLVRETTDQSSPLALQRYSAGFRVPVLVTAGGQIYISYCTDKQRETLLQILTASNNADDALAREKPIVDRIISETRGRGYAFSMRPSYGENSLAVPILSNGTYYASLIMRYMQSVMTPEKAVEDFVDQLKAAADDIGNGISQSRSAS